MATLSRMTSPHRLDVLWERQFAERVRRMYIGRALAIPIAGTLLFALAWLDGEPRRLWVVGVVAVLEFLVAVFYLAKMRRAEPTPRDIVTNVLALALGGMAFLYATGDLASPLLPLVVVPAVLTGGAFGRGAIRLLILLPAALALLLALGILSGALPRFAPLFAAHDGWRLSMYAAAIVASAAAVWRGTGVLLDDAHLLARALETANAELAQEMENRQRADAVFVAQLAHELRNPLAAVKGLTDVVRANPAAARAAEHLAVVAEEIRRLEATLDATLSFGKPTPPDAERFFELNETFFSALRILASRIERKGIAVHVDWPETFAFRGDEQGLRQVFFNLLSNAVDALASGGTITIRGTRQAGAYVVRIADSGPGVDPALAATLFEPYVTGKPNGTGLGLSVARQIARGHGGTLTYEGEPGRGAAFVLTLPFSSEQHARAGG